MGSITAIGSWWVSSSVLVGSAVAILGLDIDGFLLSQQFLGTLAGTISTLIASLLSMLLFGSA